MRRDERRDPGYVEDIVEAAGKIKNYLHGIHRGTFDRNEMLRDAVVRQLGIIGEAAACLSPTFKTAHPAQPWKDIVGLRQIVIHRYWRVNMNIIWAAAKKEVRALAAYLRKVQKKSPARLDAEIRDALAKRPKRHL